jgi:hypothetical protein
MPDLHKITEIDSAACKEAAVRLYEHLATRHVREDGAFVGPDPGVSINLRVTRFIKSYLRALPWQDRLYYLQGQAYWIWDNLELALLTGEKRYKDAALRCAEVVASRQTDEGWWHYPQAEWRNRVATVEGCFGSMCLLMGFELSQDERLLDGAKRWYGFMVDKVGFQDYDADSRAVNYFSNVGRGLVPNNSTLALWFAAALSKAAGDTRYLEHCPAMVSFLARCQADTGELPYVLESEHGPGRLHYLCFQYNAFQFLDLVEYYRIARDEQALAVMKRLAEFLSNGLTDSGDARHDCDADRPVMHYFTAAVSAALARAGELDLCDCSRIAARGYSRLLHLQKADGGFDYSLGDYGILSDRRSYPRNQAMILKHLLVPVCGGQAT